MKKIELIEAEIENFKGIKYFKINFKKETTIVGPNASGKTSLADCFKWVTYDKDSTDRADTNFSIKPINLDTKEMIMGLEPKVTFKLKSDDIELILVKKAIEKRKKKTGEFTGFGTYYEINGVEKKKNEWKALITQHIGDEEVIKQLTDTSYFAQKLKWQQRRAILTQFVEIVPHETLVEKYPELNTLWDVTKDETDVTDQITTSYNKILEEIQTIPIQIKAAEEAKFEVDLQPLYKKKQELDNRLTILNEKKQKLDIEKQNSDIIFTEINNMKRKLSDLKIKAESEASGEKQKLELKIENLKIVIQDISDIKIPNLSNKIKNNLQVFEDAENQRKILKELFAETKNKKYKDADDICPTCKQSLPEELFLETKNNSLKEIRTDGHKFKSASEEAMKVVEVTRAEVKELESKLIKYTQEHKSIVDKIKEFKIEISVERATQIKTMELGIRTKTAALTEDNKENTEYNQIIDQITEINTESNEINAEIQKADINKEQDLKIKALDERRAKIVSKLGTAEKLMNQIKQYKNEKYSQVEEELNKKFKGVTFKLFRERQNGNVEEICETRFEGIPFADVNFAGKAQAGIELINLLNKYHQVSLPIWLDNKESITTIPKTDNQIVNLKVGLKELTVK